MLRMSLHLAFLGTFYRLISSFVLGQPLEWNWLFNGFRFDLLVSGFSLIPIWVLFLIGTLLPRRKKLARSGLEKAGRMAFVLILIAHVLIYWTDSIHFSSQKIRIYQNWEWPQIQDSLMMAWSHSHWFLLILSLFSVWQIHRGIKMISHREWLRHPGWTRFIVVTAWLFFCARGSLGEHHLRRENCMNNDSSILTEVCLNPVWTFFNIHP